MEKIKLDLDIILPDIPDEKDACVQRIIDTIKERKGIGRVHVVSETETSKAKLCFHYNPEDISIDEVQKLAENSGAEITQKYGHLLLEVKGIRYVRHARVVELGLKDLKGILSVSVSATGWISIEFDHHETSPSKIYRYLNKIGLTVISPDLKSIPEHKHVYKERETHEHKGHDHAAEHSHAGHDHEHGGIFGEKTEMIFAIISGILLAIGFGISFISGISAVVPAGLYVAAYFFGGFYTTKEAIEGISKGDFEIDFLMLVAAVGAAILGHWAEGALLLFLFSLGHSLEHYAMEKARKSIAALADLAPKTAFLKTGNDIREVKIEDLKSGDIIIVRPNSKIAADGIVLSGSSSVNQAPITGESIPADKFPVEDKNMAVEKADQLEAKYKVFAGSVNGSENLEIKVTKISADSTIARLVKLVNEAQTQKSPTQNFTDKLEKYYVPAVLILVVILLFAFLVINESFSVSFYRAMAVLVAASPCALAIATPSAVLSGVARAARGGVLVKGGRPLEELGSLTAIAFDKTGTLTEGKPKLTGIYPLNGISEEKLLEIVIAVEKLSDHPLAAAIVRGGLEKLNRDVPAGTNIQSIQGRGIKAQNNGSMIFIGNKELFAEKSIEFSDGLKAKIADLEKQGNTTMIVGQENKIIGIITLMDVARKDARESLSKLGELGIRKMIMLTGDDQKVADAIAKETGITDVWGNLMPEQKVEAIEKLKASEKKVAMIGDGVNDAPAMAKSTVGIAMGAAGSDVALETADIALMSDQLSHLPFAIGLSRKANRIIKQNLIISLGMVVILIPLTILGIAHIGPAVIGHEGSTIIVVFNALRLLAY
ncbi:MAG: heavy metal translocating P-type ATPase [Sphingobacteriales bacterium UTBCD1]|jgi:Cd2+/Zn2+-exporting ATPase|nr:MAG: heavy metal translocating P-type ATPase [Sphingobacteriales bacterium UTBCD1]